MRSITATTGRTLRSARWALAWRSSGEAVAAARIVCRIISAAGSEGRTIMAPPHFAEVYTEAPLPDLLHDRYDPATLTVEFALAVFDRVRRRHNCRQRPRDRR